MAKRKKANHPHDKRKGFLLLPIVMLNSESYQSLSLYSKQLMLFLQIHWREDRPIAFGVREAKTKLNCDKRTAMKAFNELQERGFIIKIDESIFNSRTQSKARTWRLTWMPYNWLEPTREWEMWGKK